MWDAPNNANADAKASGETDRVLVERALKGDGEAFTRLHKRYYTRVYRLALFRTRSVQDAEDIASETFVRAVAHLGSFRFSGESLFPWLSRIAANLIADQGRRGAGVTVLSLDSTQSGAAGESVRALLEGLPGNAPDPHTLAQLQETRELLRTAITRLPSDQAEAISLRFIGDLSLKEIAQAMNKTEGAIKSLIHRALVNLRRALLEAEENTRTTNERHRGYNQSYSSEQYRRTDIAGQQEKRYGDVKPSDPG